MILHDLFDWTTASMGAGGLLLTAGALLQATGAKHAAIEAREAIYWRNAADAFAEIIRLAELCGEYLALERPREASLRVRDLSARIPRERERFARFLKSDSDKLKALESEFQNLAIRLSSMEFEDKIEIQTTMEAIFKATRELNAVHGRLLARLDAHEEDR